VAVRYWENAEGKKTVRKEAVKKVTIVTFLNSGRRAVKL
jgi:hypothetical protein